ncbi:MAG: hypothetical protein AAI978_00130 [Candidatus Hodgkinia cicadicola]
MAWVRQVVSDLNKIRLLRKLTNVGIMKCRQILNECDGDLSEAVKRMQLQLSKSKTETRFEGDLYIAYVRTRFGICLFKVYANANVYNNRFVWELRRVLNLTLCDLEFDSEIVLNIRQIDGILIHSCMFLKFDDNVYSIYLHNKVCDFVYKKGVLLVLSAYNCDRRYINWLGIELCKQFLFNAVIDDIKSLDKLMHCQYIYNGKYNIEQVIGLFQSKFNCKISINRALILC